MFEVTLGKTTILMRFWKECMKVCKILLFMQG